MIKCHEKKFFCLDGGSVVLTRVIKSQAQRTEAVDGSNESLDHADEKLDTLLRKYSFVIKISKHAVCGVTSHAKWNEALAIPN